MVKPYSEKKFDLPVLDGLSPESIEAHLGLYAGYVKNFNAMTAELEDLLKNIEKHPHAVAEIERRLAFEFCGMRLHERYFTQWERGTKALASESTLAEKFEERYGSFEAWQAMFKNIALMRGVGWAILYYDPEADELHSAWVGEHMQGHFATLPVILALDMWEHSFVAQFGVSGKKAYIEACFKNYNWDVMAKRLEEVV